MPRAQSAAAAPRRLAATAGEDLSAQLAPGMSGLILSRALDLFAASGFAGTSVRDIALACGIQAPSLYSHFASKQHVLAELCRVGHELHLQRLKDAVTGAGADPVAQLSAWVRAHVEVHAAYPRLSVVANAELHMLSGELGTATFSLRKESERTILGVLERGVKGGQFHIDDPWLAAAAIAAMGLRVAYWFQAGGPRTVEQVADTYAELARRIVGVAA